MPTVNLDTFTQAYIEAALWSSMDQSDENTGGYPLNRNYGIDDIHPETLSQMVADCASFLASFGPFVADDESHGGFMFWLSRNGHGAGFFDGDYEQDYPLDQLEDESDDQYDFRRRAYGTAGYDTVGDFLTAMAHPYGEFNLYVGDDNLIHGC